MLWLALAAILGGPQANGADSAGDILRRLIDSQARNDEHSLQYTYIQQSERYWHNRLGDPVHYNTQTHEVLFVEGLAYQKLIGYNGRPLSPEAQAAEEKKMLQTAEERRRTRPKSAPGGSVRFGPQSADLGSLEELLTKFQHRLLPDEEIRGRAAWVIESTPREDLVPANEHEKDIFCFRRKLWIDRADQVIARQMFTVIGDRLYAKPGTTLIYDCEPIGSDTWHATRITVDMFRPSGKTFEPAEIADYLFSGFRKFDVQSTITPIPSK